MPALLAVRLSQHADTSLSVQGDSLVYQVQKQIKELDITKEMVEKRDFSEQLLLEKAG